MANLTVQNIVDAGTPPTFGAVTASDRIPINSGHNVAHYKNGSASSVTVTVLGQGVTAYGVANPNNVITVAAGAEARIPIRKAYDDGSGYATVTTSAQTSVTVAVTVAP